MVAGRLWLCAGLGFAGPERRGKWPNWENIWGGGGVDSAVQPSRYETGGSLAFLCFAPQPLNQILLLIFSL